MGPWTEKAAWLVNLGVYVSVVSFLPFRQCFKNTPFQTPSRCNISSGVTARGLHQIKMQSRVCCVLC